MKKSLVLAASLCLTACISTEPEAPVGQVTSDLYLRGDFSLWDAQKEYQLKPVQLDVFRTKVQLAQGATYEFKVADSQWSEGLNCGYKNESEKRIELGKAVPADCNTVYNYFSFTPFESGWYQVEANFLDLENPKVTVTQVFN